MLKRFLLLAFISLLSGSLVFAESGVDDRGNPNDPAINERANACFEGGSMADKCDTQVEWDAGWFLIRFESGLLSREEIPVWVSWVLPPEVVPEELAIAPVPTTCTIEFVFGSFSYAHFGASVDVSLNTVNGIDSGATPGVYWSGTILYYGNGSAGALVWNVSWFAAEVDTTDCPTPTPF